MSQTPEIIARRILDVTPLMMRVIHTEMRSQRAADLTVPQFRVLLFISRNPGCSLLAVARSLGLTSPTIFKIVDGQVDDGLVRRQDSNQDRRKILLTLTPRGQDILQKTREGTQLRLAEIISPLSAPEREVVFEALGLLQPLFLQRNEQEKMINHGEKES